MDRENDSDKGIEKVGRSGKQRQPSSSHQDNAQEFGNSNEIDGAETEENLEKSLEDIQPPIANLQQNFARRDAVKREQHLDRTGKKEGRTAAAKRGNSMQQPSSTNDDARARPRTAAGRDNPQDNRRLNAMRSQRLQQDTEFDDSGSQGSQVHFQQLTREEKIKKRPTRGRELAIRTERYADDNDNDYTPNDQQDTEGNTGGQHNDLRRQRNQQRSRFNSSQQQQHQKSKTKKLVDKLAHGLNWEPEYSSEQTLNQRAIEMVRSDEYLNKVKLIKAGNQQIKSMEFIMDGIKIELPYLGQKLTQGYLRKETQSVNILLKREFQTKFCMLDLTKFLFKYAKAPTENFTFIHLKDIIDVYVEPDPGIISQDTSYKKSKSVFSTRSSKKDELQGFNFQIKTSTRAYRMQAQTKTEQIMWLRALTILFELRARVSQNLKTTIDINHHLYDNKLAAGLADTLSSAGLSLDYSAQASYQQRGMDHLKQKSVQSKFNQNKNLQQKKRLQQERQCLNDSQKEIDELSIDSTDIDNVNLKNQRAKVPQKKMASSRPPLNSAQKPRRGDEADELSDYGDNEKTDAGAKGRAGKVFDKRQNRFQKSRKEEDNPDDQLEDYPDMKVKKRQDDGQEKRALRSKSELLEAKKQEITRRLEANQRLMEKTKQLSEFQKDLDLQSVCFKQNFTNNQKEATTQVLKMIEKKKEALQEEAKEKESRINDILKSKTQAIDLSSSQLEAEQESKVKEQDDDEYYDEEEDYDEENDDKQNKQNSKSPMKNSNKSPMKAGGKSPMKMRPKEQAILNDLDDLMAPKRDEIDEPEIKSPVNQEKKLDSFVEKLIEKQENQKQNQPIQQTTAAIINKSVIQSKFEISQSQQAPETTNQVNLDNAALLRGDANYSQPSRNDSARISGTELLRQFRQSHQGGFQQLRNDNSQNRSGIFDMNKKKLKLIRNPKSPSPMRPLDSSTRNHVPMKSQALEQFSQQFMQTPINNNNAVSKTFIDDNSSVQNTSAVDKLNQTQDVFSHLAPAGGSRPKLKIKTIRVSQNAKNIIRQAKLQQQKTQMESTQNVLQNASMLLKSRTNHMYQEQQTPVAASASKPNQSLLSGASSDYNPMSAGRAVQKPTQDLSQTMVEVLQPQLNFEEEDEGLGAWAGKIGMRNKMKQEEKRQRENKSQVISFYDNFDKEKEQSIFDDNMKSDQMILQDIDDDDDIVIQNVGKKNKDDANEKSSMKIKNYDDFIDDDVPVIKSPSNIIKKEKHTFNTQQQSKRDLFKPQKDFSEILKREAGPSILEKVSNMDNYHDNFDSLTYENPNRNFERTSEHSPGMKPPTHQFNRDSWLHNTNSRGRRSNVQDDNRSEKEKLLDRQNSRKRNMLENSHHLHLSSSRKSITMQGQSSINHSITREKEPGVSDSQAAPVQNRRSLRPPSGYGQRSQPQDQHDDQILINQTNVHSPAESSSQLHSNIGSSFKMPHSQNIKLNKQVFDDESPTSPPPGQVPSQSQPGSRPSNDVPGNQTPLQNLGVSIENGNNTIIDQQNFDNRTQTNTTHVGKQVVNNYYILNVNSISQASIDNIEASANLAQSSQHSNPSTIQKQGTQKAADNEDFDYDW